MSAKKQKQTEQDLKLAAFIAPHIPRDTAWVLVLRDEGGDNATGAIRVVGNIGPETLPKVWAALVDSDHTDHATVQTDFVKKPN